jgi:hypothetical protein
MKERKKNNKKLNKIAQTFHGQLGSDLSISSIRRADAALVLW